MGGEGPGRRAGTILTWLLVVILMAGGAWLVRYGMTAAPPEPAPLPTQEFTVASPTPVATSWDAPAENGNMPLVTPENMEPGTILIPNIGVYARLTHETFIGGQMTLPTDVSKVGMSDTSVKLAADQGSTILAGHVNYNGANGALYRLYESRPGTAAWTKDADGALREWIQVSLRATRKGALPPDIFYLSGDRRLTIVTCGGGVVGNHYQDNVTAQFAPAST